MNKIKVRYYCPPNSHDLEFESDLSDFFEKRGFDLFLASYKSKTFCREITFRKDITKEV